REAVDHRLDALARRRSALQQTHRARAGDGVVDQREQLRRYLCRQLLRQQGQRLVAHRLRLVLQQTDGGLEQLGRRRRAGRDAPEQRDRELLVGRGARHQVVDLVVVERLQAVERAQRGRERARFAAVERLAQRVGGLGDRERAGELGGVG